MMKDYINYVQQQSESVEIYLQEWSDEFFGCPDYKEYKETWC